MGEVFNHSYISQGYIFSFRQSRKESLLDRRRLHFSADFRLYQIWIYSRAWWPLNQANKKSTKLSAYQCREKRFWHRKKLALEESQLTRLYFVAARSWVQMFRDSIAVTTSLSAVFSVLPLPCIYCLCLELFEEWVIAWLAVAIIAISLFHRLVGRECK